MVSLTWWTWVWASSESWWWTGKPGVLQSMGSQRVRHDWDTELTDWLIYFILCLFWIFVAIYKLSLVAESGGYSLVAAHGLLTGEVSLVAECKSLSCVWLFAIPWAIQVHGILKARTLSGVRSLFLLHGIFPTQGSNPGLPHYRWILYQLSHPGKPKNTGVGSLSLFQQIFLIQESNQVLLHCRWILYQLSYQGSPCCGVQALNLRASVVVVCGLQSTASVVVGLAARQHVGSSRTRSCTSVPCIARQILNHWTTREGLSSTFCYWF